MGIFINIHEFYLTISLSTILVELKRELHKFRDDSGIFVDYIENNRAYNV